MQTVIAILAHLKITQTSPSMVTNGVTLPGMYPVTAANALSKINHSPI